MGHCDQSFTPNREQKFCADCETTIATQNAKPNRQHWLYSTHLTTLWPTNHKGRRPTMRHISRTNNLNLDWFYDRITKIKYVSTNPQLADILTKGTFTQEPMTPQLTVFNLMSHSNHSRSALVVIPAVSHSSSAVSKRSENFAENNISAKAKLESCTIAMITEHSCTDQTLDTECRSIELFSPSSRISARTNPSDREGRSLMLTMMTLKNRPKCKDHQV